jgi:hypothetical protein
LHPDRRRSGGETAVGSITAIDFGPAAKWVFSPLVSFSRARRNADEITRKPSSEMRIFRGGKGRYGVI